MPSVILRASSRGGWPLRPIWGEIYLLTTTLRFSTKQLPPDRRLDRWYEVFDRSIARRELCTLAARVDGFRFIPTMTQMSTSSRRWTGETGRMDVPMLGRYLPSLVGPRYYLSGSTTFISGMCQAIEHAGVPGADIRIEMYAGY